MATAAPASPLRNPVFRALWLGQLGSNVGTWMQNVAAAWLMTSLTESAAVIALVQTATSLPVFLIAIPGGALADIVDRRRLLLVMQTWMCVAAALLGLATLAGTVTPLLLLSLTFMLGLGAAVNAPAWQAVVPDVVGRDQLAAAVALNSASFNVARAIGPALGGLLVGAFGAGAAFLVNAASFLGILFVVARWQSPPRPDVMPSERLAGAMRAGLRYVRHAGPLRAVLVRVGACMMFATALWALLPVIARTQFGLGSAGYGLLLGCIGAGAVVSSVILPKIRPRLGGEGIVRISTLVFAGVTAICATTTSLPAVAVTLFFGGMGWIGIMSSFNVSVQLTAPSWVKARALSTYLLVFQGSMAAGSVVWGIVAEQVSLPTSLLAAAAGLASTVALTRWFPIGAGEGVDLTPSMHWTVPEPVVPPGLRDGPVLVTVEYRIAPESVTPFLEAVGEVRRIRLRDGAEAWGIFQDLADGTRFFETFLVESWEEHLRQHARVTVGDRDVETRARAYHIGPEPPIVSHLIAPFARPSRLPFVDRWIRQESS